MVLIWIRTFYQGFKKLQKKFKVLSCLLVPNIPVFDRIWEAHKLTDPEHSSIVDGIVNYKLI
jgi:hypothetical protein